MAAGKLTYKYRWLWPWVANTRPHNARRWHTESGRHCQFGQSSRWDRWVGGSEPRPGARRSSGRPCQTHEWLASQTLKCCAKKKKEVEERFCWDCQDWKATAWAWLKFFRCGHLKAKARSWILMSLTHTHTMHGMSHVEKEKVIDKCQRRKAVMQWHKSFFFSFFFALHTRCQSWQRRSQKLFCAAKILD